MPKSLDITRVLKNLRLLCIEPGKTENDKSPPMVYVKVAVTVENHAIKNIDIIEHNNGRGAKAESITSNIIDKNSYDVDVLSGATLSSKTIMSAVSKALKESCN